MGFCGLVWHGTVKVAFSKSSGAAPKILVDKAIISLYIFPAIKSCWRSSSPKRVA